MSNDFGADGLWPTGPTLFSSLSKKPSSMVVSDTLTYADIFTALEETATQLSRPVNPTVYSREEFDKRIKEDNVFVKRVLSQPKLWVVGQESDLATG